MTERTFTQAEARAMHIVVKALVRQLEVPFGGVNFALVVDDLDYAILNKAKALLDDLSNDPAPETTTTRYTVKAHPGDVTYVKSPAYTQAIDMIHDVVMDFCKHPQAETVPAWGTQPTDQEALQIMQEIVRTLKREYDALEEE